MTQSKSRIFSRLLLCGFLIHMVSLCSTDEDTKEKYAFVIAKEGTVLRSRPNVQSEALRVLPLAKKVRVLGESDHLSTLLGKEANWTHVKVDSEKGWIFAPLLGQKRTDDPLLVVEQNLIAQSAYEKLQLVKKGTILHVSLDTAGCFEDFQGTLILSPMLSKKAKASGYIIDPVSGEKAAWNIACSAPDRHVLPNSWSIDYQSGGLTIFADMHITPVCHSEACLDAPMETYHHNIEFPIYIDVPGSTEQPGKATGELRVN